MEDGSKNGVSTYSDELSSLRLTPERDHPKLASQDVSPEPAGSRTFLPYGGNTHTTAACERKVVAAWELAAKAGEDLRRIQRLASNELAASKLAHNDHTETMLASMTPPRPNRAASDSLFQSPQQEKIQTLEKQLVQQSRDFETELKSVLCRTQRMRSAVDTSGRTDATIARVGVAALSTALTNPPTVASRGFDKASTWNGGDKLVHAKVPTARTYSPFEAQKVGTSTVSRPIGSPLVLTRSTTRISTRTPSSTITSLTTTSSTSALVTGPAVVHNGSSTSGRTGSRTPPSAYSPSMQPEALPMKLNGHASSTLQGAPRSSYSPAVRLQGVRSPVRTPILRRRS